MSKIKINDLPKYYKISEDEMRRIRGGILLTSTKLPVFQKVDGIDGESTDDKHKDWIDVL